MRRSFSRRPWSGRRKRSVAWIPGLTGLNTSAPAQAKTLAFAQIGASNTYGGAIGLTNEEDLKAHGGEDCVLYRMVYDLWFYGFTYNEVGPSITHARLLFVQEDTNLAGELLAVDYTTSEGIGRDNILHERELHIGSTNLDTSSGAGGWDPAIFSFATRVQGEVKSRRKLQADRQLFLWVQTVRSGALIPTAVTYSGSVRMLLARPR